MNIPTKNRCPVCKEKWKKCHCPKKTAVNLRLFAVLVTILFLVLMFIIFQNKHTINTAQRVYETETLYYQEKNKVPEMWWLSNLPRTPEDRVFIEKLAFQENRIKNTLNRLRKISPLAGQIRDKFEKFTVSVFLGGKQSITISRSREVEDSKVEICFVSKQQSAELIKQVNAPSSLYWRSDWGLFINAISVPEGVFDGFILHELGHGFKHPVSLTGEGYFNPQSKEYAAEEIEMHELETLVFNEVSEGAFDLVIKKIIGRVNTGKSFKNVLSQVTLADLLQLDKCLGAEKACLETSSLLFAHYMIAIGCAHIDNQKQGDTEKIAMFRWLHEEVFSRKVMVK